MQSLLPFVALALLSLFVVGVVMRFRKTSDADPKGLRAALTSIELLLTLGYMGFLGNTFGKSCSDPSTCAGSAVGTMFIPFFLVFIAVVAVVLLISIRRGLKWRVSDSIRFAVYSLSLLSFIPLLLLTYGHA